MGTVLENNKWSIMAKKPNLKKALKKIDSMPEHLFGRIDINLKTLPCVMKPAKEKITANLDSDLLKAIRRMAKAYGTSYTALMNDVLREVFINKKIP